MNHSAALNEARRVLKSGSILTLTDLPLLSVSKMIINLKNMSKIFILILF